MIAFFALGCSSLAQAQQGPYFGAPYYHNSYDDNGPHDSVQAVVDAWWNDWLKHWPEYAHCGYSIKISDPKTESGKAVAMSPGSPCSGTAYGFATEYAYDPYKNLGPPTCDAPGTHCGNPINVAIGNKYQGEEDIAASAEGLAFYRHYNSHAATADGHIGEHWTHNYDLRLLHLVDSTGLRSVAMVRPDGNRVVFDRIGEQWRADPDVHAKIVHQGDLAQGVTGWTYTPQDSREIERYDKLGRLARIERTDGSWLAFTYNDGAAESGGESDYLLTRIETHSGRSMSLRYGADLRVAQVIDPAGQEYRYGYDSEGRLASVTYPGGGQRLYHYNETAHTGGANMPNALTGITREDGKRYATFAYAADGRAVSSEHAGGADKFVAAYGDGATTVATPNGATQRRSFSMFHGVKKAASVAQECVGCASRVTAYTYDADGHIDTVTDPRGTVVDYDHDARGLATRIVEAKNDATARRSEEIDWHPQWRVPLERRVLDAAGRLVAKTVWTYNSRGQPITETRVDPAAPSAARTVSYDYCDADEAASGSCPSTGLLLSIDGPRDDVSDLTRYVYYPGSAPGCDGSASSCAYRKGDLWKIENALGQTSLEILGYDSAGRPLSTKDINGVATDYEYHPRGWLLAMKQRGPDDAVETDDLITRIDYYSTGLTKRVTLPDGNFTSFVYDEAHRLTGVSDRSGAAVQYTLDLAGNRKVEDLKNAAGTVQASLSRVFDALGQLRTHTDGLGHATTLSYDNAGLPDTVTDALGRVSDQDHDPLGRLVRTLRDVGAGRINAETRIEYDALDQVTKVIDPKGLPTLYARNGFGELTQLTSPDTGVTGYTYDTAGQTKTRTDARGVTTAYRYDALGRLTQQSYPNAALGTTNTYDAVASGCVAGETYSKGRLSQSSDAGGTLRYCYDRFGRIVRKIALTSGPELTLRYAYTAAGALESVTYPDGNVVDYVRGNHGRITQIGVTRPGGIREVLLTAAEYAAYGPPTGWVYGNNQPMARELDRNYAVSRLAGSAPDGLSLHLGRDDVGNVSRFSTQDQTAILSRYQYDRLDRLIQTQDGPTGTPLETYAYDATGNRTSFQAGAGVAQDYAYSDTSHRLQSVGGIARTYDGAGNTTTVGGTAKQYVYDDSGRLAQFKSDGVVKMNYVYNGLGQQVRRYDETTDRHSLYAEDGRWLGEYDDAGAALQQIVWMDELPVGVIQGAGATQKLYYIEPDHLGTPRVVVDPGRNRAVWTWSVKGEAFGNTAPNEDPDLDGAKFLLDIRFPGQRFDAASGLIYNYFRDYAPAIGRYIQSDPIGQLGGASTYGYVHANPIGRGDPFGLKDHTECETRRLLDQARHEVSGSFWQGGKNAWTNHTAFGKFDFKTNSPTSDTFNVDGKRYSPAAFGNFIAAYAGWHYAWGFGYAAVRAGGVYYDFVDARAGSGTFDFDMDSNDDLVAGAKYAQQQLGGAKPPVCGCAEL